MDFELTRPAVSLTDFALAIQCSAFAALLARRSSTDPRLRKWFVVFFGSIAAASLLGGITHGFFEYSTSPIRGFLWTTTLLSILLTSFATWSIAAIIQLEPPVSRWVQAFALAQIIVLTVVVLFISRQFVVAIVAYLPATVFLFIAVFLAYRRRLNRALAWGVAGLALTFVGAAVQQLKLAAHPVYLDHNTLYHVIQFVAFWMLYHCARWMITTQPIVRRPNGLET